MFITLNNFSSWNNITKINFLEEGFRQEVRAQTNLAELYKKQAEDADEKSEKLSDTIIKLQGLLKQAGERYGALEDHYEKEKVDHKDELKRRNDAIRALRKELTDANGLIDTLKQRGLTEEGIQALSPAAAAASKLIKSGMSLTQVYSQLVACQVVIFMSRTILDLLIYQKCKIHVISI